MGEHKRAVVVGALGDRATLSSAAADGWSSSAPARRARPIHGALPPHQRRLLNGGPQSSPAWRATHVFYAAFQPAAGAAGYASNIAPNRDMLVNAVTTSMAPRRCAA